MKKKFLVTFFSLCSLFILLKLFLYHTVGLALSNTLQTHLDGVYVKYRDIHVSILSRQVHIEGLQVLSNTKSPLGSIADLNFEGVDYWMLAKQHNPIRSLPFDSLSATGIEPPNHNGAALTFKLDVQANTPNTYRILSKLEQETVFNLSLLFDIEVRDRSPQFSIGPGKIHFQNMTLIETLIHERKREQGLPDGQIINEWKMGYRHAARMFKLELPNSSLERIDAFLSDPQEIAMAILPSEPQGYFQLETMKISEMFKGLTIQVLS